MLEETTKTIQGEVRKAMRWGSDGKVYVCSPDGDCEAAALKALAWARENGVPPEEIASAGTLLASTEPAAPHGGADDAVRRERRRRMVGR